MLRLFLCAVIALSLALHLTGCSGGEEVDVVLYTSIDEPAAREIVDAFEQETGYTVRLVTDTEATKSVGLAERLRAEAQQPQADVWWGNEPFYTLRLAEEGLLQPYESPSLGGIDTQYIDPQHRWAGNGLRARVLGVRAQHSSAPEGFRSLDGLEDLTDPSLDGLVVLARPTAGTTGGHVAALYTLWGQERADEFFASLYENNATVVAGNSQAAQQVGRGSYWVALTDNDDVANVQATGGNIRAMLPDQGEGGMGTLTIPTTIGLVAGRPENQAAKALVDFLLSAETEQRLLNRGFVAYSVRPDGGEETIKAMAVNYAQVARLMPEAIRRATALLEGRKP